MKRYLDDILFIAGGLVIVAGCYMVQPFLAVFAGGVLLIALGILVGRGGGDVNP